MTHILNLEEFYTSEKQKEYGVLGIKIAKI
jgi:hypothetical protein